MSAETPAAASGQFAHRRLQFRAWRGTRPFWAGLYVLLSGLPIMYFPYFHLQVGHLTLAMATTAGAGSLIIGVLLIVLGISLWFQKHVQTFAGVAAILLALVSLPVSNFGGFIMGFLLALIGGAMAVAWSPGATPQEEPPGEAAPGEGGAPQAAPLPQRHVDGVGDAGPYQGYPALGENDLSGTSPANGANGRHSAG
ncbi:DUF6114 domain-containing protein [Streptomyces sp. MMG1121]|uniref:DUF6114 domain-containing protein n=1 Tax=Streptomyces sp. MMG1121 TaxID=1415544 RepID=UPI0006B0542C|nr:DUF6114 domain-containing protein [Streptomyces sp. MMG1121]KOV60746.1 membrane protein [Streptomyces sp. MMG1121]